VTTEPQGAPHPNEDDRALAIAARGGDPKAFEQLVLRHKTSLYRLARRYVGDPDDAYDVVQQTFVSAWQALRRLDPSQLVISWLRTILLNKCRDHARRRAVRRRILALFLQEFPSSFEPPAGILPDEEDLTQQRLRRLDRAIAELPPKYKEPLLLTLVSGLTHPQVARELNMTVKAVEMRIRRARLQLAAALEDATSATADSARQARKR
jgi:RNA polymerase sigma factor CnrH